MPDPFNGPSLLPGPVAADTVPVSIITVVDGGYYEVLQLNDLAPEFVSLRQGLCDICSRIPEDENIGKQGI